MAVDTTARNLAVTALKNSGGSGVTVHNRMTGRDAANAHPISAITGLSEYMEGILPIVQRIRVLFCPNAGVEIELDKPAPENCYIQLFRYSRKKTATRGKYHLDKYGNPRPQALSAYRPIDISNANFPMIKIEKGSTRVLITDDDYDALYRPVKVRGNVKSPTRSGRTYNPINDKKDSKVKYKIGTCVYRDNKFYKSPMSQDTLFIIKYRFTVESTTCEKINYSII